MALNAGMFHSSELVAVYAPPNLREVMPGNRVMLRSGGPEMIVCEAFDNGTALCNWADPSGALHSHIFDLRCLTCYGAR